ncbi:hypothetical protein BDBG_18117, partial [Blastomyces gilchristii SLH14081]
CTIMNNTSSLSSYILSTVFFSAESSCIDRSAFTDNSELNVESLIKNLKNMIMKKLLILCVIRSSMSLSVSSITSFPAALSLSSILISMSDSLTSATSVLITLTSATSDFTVSAFIISSSHFKKILYRLNKLHFSRITLSLNSVKIAKDIHVFRNRNVDVVLFYTYRHEA